jgi:hypothetical protein
MKLRTKVAAGTILVLAAAGYGSATNAAGHHDGESLLTVITSGMPANERLANQMAAQMFGWGAGQQHCLDLLWTRESAGTWSPTVVNPTSGAYGIVQSLPASKLADPAQGGGPDWRTSAATQIRWGLTYIHDRPDERTPCGAWAHELASNWY